MSKFFQTIFIIVCGIAFLMSGCQSDRQMEEITGKWETVLPAPPVEITIELDIHSPGSDAISAMLAIPEENVSGLPLDNVVISGSILQFAAPELAIFYRGLVDETVPAITGDFVRGRERYPLQFKKAAGEPGIIGKWVGTVRFPARKLGFQLDFSTDWRGQLNATFFSPELKAANVPLASVEYSSGKISFRSGILRGDFSGEYDRNSQTIHGQWFWQQNLQSASVNFTRVEPRDSLSYLIPQNMNDDWTVAEPQAAGMNFTPLDSLFAALRAGQYPGLRSMLVAKSGRLVLETYPAMVNATTLQDWEEVSFSVNALLCGIAIDRGYMVGVDETVFPLIDEYPDIANRDERKAQITIGHLLSMRSGLGCNDGSRTSLATEEKVLRGLDWVKLMLDLPVAYPPGELWMQCAANGALLTAALENATRMRLENFAQNHLFSRLGIAEVKWGVSPAGRAYGGGMLQLRSRDMAKIGQLVMQRGRWEGKTVVSEDWIEQMLRPQAEAWGANAPSAEYGYGWWGKTIAGQRVYFAMGKGGQYLIIVPSQELVMVISTRDSKPAFDPRGLEILEKYLLPACL